MSHRWFVQLVGWLVAWLGLAGLLAPPLYWALLKLQDLGCFPSAWAGVAFDRVLRRCLLLVALAGLLVGFLRLPIKGRRLVLSGLRPFPWFQGLAALLTSSLGLLLSLVPLWWLQWLHWLRWPTVKELLAALGMALTVAILEEMLFRGALLGWLCRQTTLLVAQTLGVILFVVPHFLHGPKHMAGHWAGESVVLWHSGLSLVPQMFTPLMDPWAIWPHSLCLVFLALSCQKLVQQTGSLVAAIGFHGGLIFTLRLAQISFAVKEPSYWLTWDFRGGLIPTLVVWLSGMFLMAAVSPVGKRWQPSLPVGG